MPTLYSSFAYTHSSRDRDRARGEYMVRISLQIGLCSLFQCDINFLEILLKQTFSRIRHRQTCFSVSFWNFFVHALHVDSSHILVFPIPFLCVRSLPFNFHKQSDTKILLPVLGCTLPYHTFKTDTFIRTHSENIIRMRAQNSIYNVHTLKCTNQSEEGRVWWMLSVS